MTSSLWQFVWTVEWTRFPSNFGFEECGNVTRAADELTEALEAYKANLTAKQEMLWDGSVKKLSKNCDVYVVSVDTNCISPVSRGRDVQVKISSTTIPCWKNRFSSDHRNQAASGADSTWMGDRLGTPRVVDIDTCSNFLLPIVHTTATTSSTNNKFSIMTAILNILTGFFYSCQQFYCALRVVLCGLEGASYSI